jgi:polyhydroxyalkanoate synthesis regulator phasin
MMDLFNKAFLTGVGLAALTAEKAEEFAKELAKTAQLSGEKGKEFVDEVMARSEKARHDLEAVVQRLTAESLKRLNLPTRDDIAKLNDRVAELERMVASKPQ